MSEIPEPSYVEFAEKYRDVIRVGLNWQRFFAEKWPIELVTLDSAPALGRCFMPWYIGPKGEEVAYDDAAAVPMCLTDVPKAVQLLNEERRVDIDEKVDSFRQQEVVQFAAPSYALPDDQYFILDKNHRLSALTLHTVPFKVTLWNVQGPIESDCLLDLIHWLPPRKTSDD